MQTQRQKQRQWQRIESTCFNPSDPCSLVHSSTSSLCPTRSGASPTQGTICHKTFLSEKKQPGEETRRVLPSLYNVMSNESKIKCVFFSPRKLERSSRKSLCREKLNYERWSEERVADCWIEAGPPFVRPFVTGVTYQLFSIFWRFIPWKPYIFWMHII